MKVLGCAGDGGAIVTSDDDLSDKLRALRNHGGGKGYGVNSRLDNLQAAILNVKLPYLDKWIARRREIAAIYHLGLPEWVKKPPPPEEGPYFDTYSSYVIGGSPELLAHMRYKGIECFSHVRDDVVSLPIYPEMKDAHIAMVIAAVKSFV
jgi:dTDP-4-amino-4,6-dideoxygalactose transaminase